jgi:hypothetical protein
MDLAHYAVTMQHRQEQLQRASRAAGEKSCLHLDYEDDLASADCRDMTENEQDSSEEGRPVALLKHFRYFGKKVEGDTRPVIRPMHILGLAKLPQVCGGASQWLHWALQALYNSYNTHATVLTC